MLVCRLQLSCWSDSTDFRMQREHDKSHGTCHNGDVVASNVPQFPKIAVSLSRHCLL